MDGNRLWTVSFASSTSDRGGGNQTANATHQIQRPRRQVRRTDDLMAIRGYPWLVVGLLWAVALLNYLDRQVIFSLFPLIRADLRLSSLELGFLSTAFLWTYAIVSPLGGFLADRYGRRRVILLSLAVWSLVTFATGQARNFGELVAIRALMGVSEACYLPAALALITEYHGGHTRSL